MEFQVIRILSSRPTKGETEANTYLPKFTQQADCFCNRYTVTPEFHSRSPLGNPATINRPFARGVFQKTRHLMDVGKKRIWFRYRVSSVFNTHHKLSRRLFFDTETAMKFAREFRYEIDWPRATRICRTLHMFYGISAKHRCIRLKPRPINSSTNRDTSMSSILPQLFPILRKGMM